MNNARQEALQIAACIAVEKRHIELLAAVLASGLDHSRPIGIEGSRSILDLILSSSWREAEKLVTIRH